MSDLVDRVTGIVHEPTQTEGAGVDITVAEVSEVTGAGRVDFGGGELEAAETAPHPTTLRNPDDEYEWWHLDAGQYLLAFNEALDTPEPVLVQPRDAILERGAFHPTLRTTDLGRVPLAVGGAGLKLKANARVATVLDPGA
jgi:deoxycytidine triphosphate deaminase